MAPTPDELRVATRAPGGNWPRSSAENHSDVTVTDGDAEWSFER